MKRRELLATCGCCMSALAGCAFDGEPTTDAPRHPFAEETVSVRIDNRSDTDHDVERNAREALEYWTENADSFVGFDVDFEVVETDPDMTIAYVDTPEPCRNVEGFSEQVLGCAPLLRPGVRVPTELTAYVVATNRPFGKIRITTKHEIGHVLGLYHDDEPREIMSNRPEDRIPLYDVRIDIWERVLGSENRSNDGVRLFNLGVRSWNDEEYEAARAAFGAANDEFSAGRDAVNGALDRTAEFVDHPRVETVALEDLRRHLRRLVDRLAAAVGFTEHMRRASAAVLAGETDRANSERTAANDQIRTFSGIGEVELREIAVTLGLVRGFDRDDPVVDVDEETVERD